MAEERWHAFAKEKPSEDMEGRNFIVSNGHYEKIATWCGYWENEPFMGDRLCDEVVRWKFYFTPEEEKANEATCTELKAYNVVASSETENYINGETNLAFEAYDVDDVDALITKKDMEIFNLKEELSYIKADSTFDRDKNKELLKSKDAEIAELKRKLEDVQATAYADSVDAGMRERRLRRALWLAREWRAWCEVQFWFIITGDEPRDVYHLSCTRRIHRTPTKWIAYWQKVEQLCRAKAEEYK